MQKNTPLGLEPKFLPSTIYNSSSVRKAKDSATGTRTQVSCVRGKYDNHLHHGGQLCASRESNTGPNEIVVVFNLATLDFTTKPLARTKLSPFIV
eukprot:scaffold10295_cov124-Alexandrium_tamarense.AAC.1